ncbi:hypothetical protein HK102_005115 [Quaeritorhiza haematococci]|nr:hypothetical protein HK102_005115 [Quaeritorhiza haematococci]
MEALQRDLCLLTNGESVSFLRLNSLPKTFGLELIESILSNHYKLFKSHPELLSLLKDRGCPLVIKSFSEKNEYPLTVRLMRVVQIIIKHFHDTLMMECEIFLSMFIKLLEPDHAPLWQRVLVMEAYKDLCTEGGLIRSLYRVYDAKDHSTKIIHEMVTGFSRIIVSERPYLLLTPVGPAVTSPDSSSAALGPPAVDQYALTVSAATVKMQCLDQLDKGEPPPIPDTYIIYLTIIALTNLVEGMAAHVLPLLQKPKEEVTPEDREEILLSIEMPKSSWSAVLAALSFLVTASIDDDIFFLVVKAYQSFTNVVGFLGLNAQRDAFLGSLCKVCVPNPTSISLDVAGSLQVTSGLSNTSTFARGSLPLVLHDRNCLCLRALLNVAQVLNAVLEDKAWYMILETLQIADGLISTGKMGKRESSSAALLKNDEVVLPAIAALKENRQRSLSGASTSGPLNPALFGGGAMMNQQSNALLDNQFVILLMFIKRLFESSKSMDDRSFAEFVRALCRLARDSATGSTTAATAVVNAAGSKDSMKVAEEKSFAVAKLQDVALSNIARLISHRLEDGSNDRDKEDSAGRGSVTGASQPFQVWDIIINQLIEIAHCPTCPVSIRVQVCQTLSEILTSAVQVGVGVSPTSTAPRTTAEEVEMKILEPLKRLLLVDTVISSPEAVEEREKVVRGPWFVDVQKWGLETLNKMLQTSGQNLTRGWKLIFDIVRSVVSASRLKKKHVSVADAKAGVVADMGGAIGDAAAVSAAVATVMASESAASGVGGGGSGGGKAAMLIRVAFPCLQLICTDFLALLSPPVLFQCIETLGSFGSQQDDLNISLTAVGLLWSVSDFVLTKRQELEKSRTQDPSAAPAGTAESASLGSSSESASPGTHPVASEPQSDDSSLTRVLSGSPPRLRSKNSRSRNVELLEGPVTTKTMDVLWMVILSHLSQLCSDPRPEVRNSANQTLFRTIGMNGQRLTLEAWDECIWNVLFPLLERVKVSSDRVEIIGRVQQVAAASSASGTGGGGSEGSSPVKSKSGTSGSVVMHHSRNTAAKQWDETKVLTLSGVTKSFTDFLAVLIDLGDGFDRAWGLFLDYIKDWCLEGSAEVAMAAVKSLRTLVRYPKDFVAQGKRSTGAAAGSGGDADSEPKKLPENVQKRAVDLWKVAWEVWEAIGVGILGRSDEFTSGQNTPRLFPALNTGESSERGSPVANFAHPSLHGSAINTTISTTSHNTPSITSNTSTFLKTLNERPRILHGNFTQEALSAYVSVFPDLYDVIKDYFGTFELRRLLSVLSALLLYHTNPVAGPAGRYRDLSNDLETMTTLQQTILDFLAPELNNDSGVGSGTKGIHDIEGAPELILSTVAGLIRLPFVRQRYMQSLTNNITNNKASGDLASDFSMSMNSGGSAAAGSAKTFTYIALSKRSMVALVTLFEKYARLRPVYSGGVFEQILESLGEPMRAKYDCPAVGQKDSTPLWKCAAQSFIAVVRLGLDALNLFIKDLPLDMVESIYRCLLDIFEAFLLPISQAPSSLSNEELSADEAFDISVLTTIETDVVLHMGQPHVSDEVICRMVNIVLEGSRLYRLNTDSQNTVVTTSSTVNGQNAYDVSTVAAAVVNSTTRRLSSPRARTQMPSSASFTRLNNLADGAATSPGGVEPVLKIRGGTGGDIKADVSGAYTLGHDIIPVARENFAISCIDTLFGLCSVEKTDNIPIRERIAVISAPILLDKGAERGDCVGFGKATRVQHATESVGEDVDGKYLP